MSRDKGHWEGVANPNEYYGFIYLIRNNVSGQQYIGRKFYHMYKKRNPVKESNWKTYTGSCKPLNEDIKELGKSKFSFIILTNYKTRGGVVSGEVQFQNDNDVLIKFLPDGNRAFYNGQTGSVKFIPKESLSRLQRDRISKRKIV